MDTSLSVEELKDILISLNMRINYIQTGNVVLSADDAVNSGKKHLVKALSEDQMRLILRMKDTFREIEKIIINNGNARLIGI